MMALGACSVEASTVPMIGQHLLEKVFEIDALMTGMKTSTKYWCMQSDKKEGLHHMLIQRNGCPWI